jgi:hypothetical protein
VKSLTNFVFLNKSKWTIMNQNLLNPKKMLALLTFSVGFSSLSTAQAIIRDTLFFTGGEQNYTIPCGVTSVIIDAFGGKGANGTNGGNNSIGGVGGLGGHAQGVLSVTSGQSLTVVVGGQATGVTGGYNGGGFGGNAGTSFGAGGGGGATDIRLGGNTIGDRILVAGGGGGGGTVGCESTNATGGDGGLGGGGNGINGNDVNNNGLIAGGGRGAIGMTGGAGGVGCNGFLGTIGQNAVGAFGGDGGIATTCCCSAFPSVPNGGGGGGGFEGGGGGGGGSAGNVGCSTNDKGAGGGGAGGTNYVGSAFTSPITVNGVNNGNGYVVFSYPNPIPNTPETTGFATAFCAGTTVSYEITPDPLATDYTWTVTGDLTIVSGQGTDSITVTGTGNNGTISVLASNACGSSLTSTPITVSINQNPVLTIATGDFSVCPGEEVTLEASGADTYVWTGGVENATAFIPTSTQTYTVTGTNTATGCSAQQSQLVTVNPVPNPTVSSSLPSPFCAGVDVTLNGTPAGGTFAVTSGDANALTGNTFNASAQGAWVISYTVTNPQGCTGSNTINLSTNCTVGLSQLDMNTLVNVYPNPTTGQFKITSELNESGELQLFNQAGQLVYKKSLQNLKENDIDIKNLEPGIYNLQMSSKSKKITVKLNVIR